MKLPYLITFYTNHKPENLKCRHRLKVVIHWQMVIRTLSNDLSETYRLNICNSINLSI